LTNIEVGFIILLVSSVLIYHRPSERSEYDVWFAPAEFGILIGLYLIMIGL